jgi:hypothetical protein
MEELTLKLISAWCRIRSQAQAHGEGCETGRQYYRLQSESGFAGPAEGTANEKAEDC